MMPSAPAFSFEDWRAAARPMLAAGMKADGINWETAPPPPAAPAIPAEVRLPRALMRLLENLSCFRHPGRWELMYRLAYRIHFENPRLLEDAADPDVANALSMDRAIRRDCHKMHAFVRFREIDDGGGAAYFAWFEPAHEILRKGADFFVQRFPNMCWTIATPDGTAVWDRTSLRFLDSPREGKSGTDAFDELWRTYYRSICNTARINPAAMQREMPQRYWRNLPEAAEIGALIRGGAADFASRHRESDETRNSLTRAVKRSLPNPPPPGEGPQSCRRCDLWRHATQAVEGRGARAAALMLVGEQPGDEEDLRGEPFVGPAGKVLDGALAAAGIERHAVFITNAVKHFKWEPRGKRRLHKKPDVREIDACNIWLELEIDSVKPGIIVALGATALRALLGATESIKALRGRPLFHRSGAPVLATYHPSAILRAEGEQADELRAALIHDLALARETAERNR